MQDLFLATNNSTIVDSRKIAIIGAGDAGRRHANALSQIENAAIAWVADANKQRLEQFVSEILPSANINPTKSLPYYLAEVANICTPPAMHQRQAEEALSAGLHILVEKPVCVSEAELEWFLGALNKYPSNIGVISQHRMAPASVAARKRIQGGNLGKMSSIDIRIRRRRSKSYFQTGWKGKPEVAGGGVLISLAVHILDVLTYCGFRPTIVSADIGQFSDGEVENQVLAKIRCDEAVELTLDAKVGDFDTEPDSLIFHGMASKMTWSGDSFKGPDITIPRAINLHKLQIESFLNEISTDSPCSISVASIAPTMLLIFALYESAASGGKWVPVRQLKEL